MDWRESQPELRCGICHEKGHNHKTCPNVSMTSTSGVATNYVCDILVQLFFCAH